MWYLPVSNGIGLAMANKTMTVEAFFEWQLGQEDRYELVEGLPAKMMAGASTSMMSSPSMSSWR